MEFVRASRAKDHSSKESVYAEQEMQLSFSPDDSYLYFTCLFDSSLPKRAALIELARECCNHTRLLACPSGQDGLACIGSSTKSVEAKIRKAAKTIGLKLNKVQAGAKLGNDAKGIPSGLVMQIVDFAVTTTLFNNRYSILCGNFFVHAFDASASNRVGVKYAIVPITKEGDAKITLMKVVVTKDGAEHLRGASKPDVHVVPGMTRYTLPNSSTAQVVDVVDKLTASDTMNEGTLRRYWKTLYGIEYDEKTLYARCRLGGGSLFTYPTACLITSTIGPRDGKKTGEDAPRVEQERRSAAESLVRCAALCPAFRNTSLEE